MPEFTAGGAVLIEDGLRFDLARVLDACEALIQACTVPFGTPIIRTVHEAYARRFPWPDPGKSVFRDTWLGISRLYEAVYEPMVVAYDRLTLNAYLLGMTWCEYRDVTAEFVTPLGQRLSELDPTPGIRIYGPEHGVSSFERALPEIVDLVERVVTGPLSGLGLLIQKETPMPASTDSNTFRQRAKILFPHETYGNGRGPIRVRCVRRP